MTNKHTPWVFSTNINDTGDKPFEEACIEDSNGEIVGFFRDIDKAKHIVHCVNLHDELVEALTNCVHHLYPLLHNVEKSDVLEIRIRQAENALKKAKGEA